MKYRALSLACMLGMSTLLFAGCGGNNGNNGNTGNNGTNTKNANPGSLVRNVTDPGSNGNGGGNGNRTNTTRIADFRSTGSGNASGGRNDGNPSGNGRGTSTSSVGALGTGDLNGYLRSLGVPSSDVLLLGNLMVVGVNQQNQNANTGNAAGMRRSDSGASGTTGSNRSGSAGQSGSGSGQAGADAAGSRGGTGDNASSTASSDDMLRAHFGPQFRVMKVSDRRAVQAMERVRRNLYTASSIRSQSSQLVQDIHYIVSKATDVSSHP